MQYITKKSHAGKMN